MKKDPAIASANQLATANKEVPKISTYKSLQEGTNNMKNNCNS
jgi:hypothetical protein